MSESKEIKLVILLFQKTCVLSRCSNAGPCTAHSPVEQSHNQNNIQGKVGSPDGTEFDHGSLLPKSELNLKSDLKLAVKNLSRREPNSFVLRS
jgi:hypothetical protein